ncbi:alpha/beta hydrolase family esterase [Jannaschia seohaensis]|uniref:Polyhydroxybutyrate depolymerase n=1 Tax=Jannaschia seohaensis TaxID=475081 RepID=A0A2Y9C410_9RHOB|nr:polyhydroxybutyrate depolymerase [Jannaschia seohaensis]PWJ22485.1 polyhydroxybutyrate depolymerase [Jannaschia seohaensis]SSA38763.1 polyhydroxybutyrate depolymerase [Jannaschia seohaensis]
MRVLVLLLLLGAPAAACTGAVECALGDRAYHVREPEGWDGRAPLPVMLHFHGWGRQGETIMGHGRIAGATVPRGVLLVAPDGLGRSWAFRRPGSRDTPFARAVLEDVAARYPLDGRLIVSGYSWGALMAARFVCEGGHRVDALLLVAGAFPPGTACAGRPWRVAHVHGTTDTVLDFPTGPDGDITYAVALWRDALGCAGHADRRYDWQAVSWLTHDRHEWDCAEGAVSLDVHPASHVIPRGWFARVLDEILH